MRSLTMIGAVLILLGIIGLAIGNFSYTKTDKVAEIGPVEINKTEEHNVSIPTIGGIIVVLAGIGMVIAGGRKSA
jgi:hypothetical protein